MPVDQLVKLATDVAKALSALDAMINGAGIFSEAGALYAVVEDLITVDFAAAISSLKGLTSVELQNVEAALNASLVIKEGWIANLVNSGESVVNNAFSLIQGILSLIGLIPKPAQAVK